MAACHRVLKLGGKGAHVHRVLLHSGLASNGTISATDCLHISLVWLGTLFVLIVSFVGA